MDTAEFDFDLPNELIALRPAAERDAARLLVVGAASAAGKPDIADQAIADLPQFLRPGDVLVFNDTKVIPAALVGMRGRDGAETRVTFNLVQRISETRWLAFAKPGRRLAVGDVVSFVRSDDADRTGDAGAKSLQAVVAAKQFDGLIALNFTVGGTALDRALNDFGAMPLPPYIAGKRAADANDRERYQTVYARHEGAVAAPTAGFHFTDDLFASLDAHGVARHYLTLHVGAGTFLPVKSDRTEDHDMHPEWGVLSAETAAALNATRARGGRIVAVGTTSLRLLESAVDDAGQLQAFSGETRIFITPGFRFRAVDALMTNFHLPRSTLFMLVAAFAGLETMQAAYAHAIAAGYQFYSYGDATLLFPPAAADIATDADTATRIA